MPKEVIDRVHVLARREQPGITFGDRTGAPDPIGTLNDDGDDDDNDDDDSTYVPNPTDDEDEFDAEIDSDDDDSDDDDDDDAGDGEQVDDDVSNNGEALDDDGAAQPDDDSIAGVDGADDERDDPTEEPMQTATTNATRPIAEDSEQTNDEPTMDLPMQPSPKLVNKNMRNNDNLCSSNRWMPNMDQELPRTVLGRDDQGATPTYT
jgi:hypothetical protein